VHEMLMFETSLLLSKYKWANSATLIFISIGCIYSMIFSKVKTGFDKNPAFKTAWTM